MPPKPPDEPGSADDSRPRGEAYVEFKQVGQAMKVTAIDAETGIEVVIMGPVTATPNDLKRVAIRKLKAQLGKSRDDDTPEPDDSADPEQGGPKGWIV